MAFYLYKGLKKPLIFFGLKNKYIFQALAVVATGVIISLALTKIGLIGALIGLGLTAGGIYLIFRRQDSRGLYDKTDNKNQIFIFPKKVKIKKSKS